MAESPFKKRLQAAPTAAPGASPFAERMQEARPMYESTPAEDISRSILQGLTFGYGDEALSGINAGINWLFGDGDFGSDYDAYLARERGLHSKFAEENPALAMGTEIAGAVPTAFALPFAGARAAAPLAKIAGGAASGMAGGAAYGFGTGEGDAEQRLMNAILPAGVGTIAGGLAPILASGVSKVAGDIGRRSTAKKADVPAEAVEPLSAAVKMDAPTAAKGAAGEMLGDMGVNTRNLLDLAIQRSGPAGMAARKAIDDRVSVAAGQINAALDDALGAPAGGVRTLQRQLREGSREGVSEAYDVAYAQPIDYASEAGRGLEEMLRDRVPAGAFKAANRLMRMEGQRTKQLMLDDKGMLKEMPDVRQVDYIVRGLNQAADKEAGKGAMGATTQLGRAYTSLARDLRGTLRDMVPEYNAALGMAAEPIAARKALDLGRGVLRSGTTRDDVAEEMAGMSPAEQRHVAQGVREFIDDTMANVRRAFTDPNMDAREAAKALKDLSSRSNRDKLTLVLGKERANALFKTLDDSTAAFELKASVAQNSKTFQRQHLDQTTGGAAEQAALRAADQGMPGVAREAMTTILRGGPRARAQAQAQQDAAMADALTRPATPAAVETLRAAPAQFGAGAETLARLLAGRVPLAAGGQARIQQPRRGRLDIGRR